MLTRSDRSRWTLDEILARITATGIPDPGDARSALGATLGVLGQRLTDEEAKALGRLLPDELAAVLDRHEYGGAFGAEEFFERVRRRERTRASAAREDADTVLAVIGELATPEVARQLERALPERLARNLRPRETGDVPEHPEPPSESEATTLASGRPGSRHPISEARRAPVR